MGVSAIKQVKRDDGTLSEEVRPRPRVITKGLTCRGTFKQDVKDKSQSCKCLGGQSVTGQRRSAQILMQKRRHMKGI